MAISDISTLENHSPKYSKKIYDKACIVFDNEIATARKKEVCNEIKPYGGTATDYMSKTAGSF